MRSSKLILGQEVRGNLEEFRVGERGTLGWSLDDVNTSSALEKNYCSNCYNVTLKNIHNFV